MIFLRCRAIVVAVSVLGSACASHTSATRARPAATDPTLRAELLRRASADQQIRERFMAALRTEKSADSALVAQVWSVDADNTAWLRDMVARHGWPGRSMVGADGAEAAFLLIQHADGDTAFQARVLPLLTQAYRAGEATGPWLALLTDRVATARGEPQVYGTQTDRVAGRAIVKPIRDSAGVDARRASVGLPALSEYLRFIDSVNTARPRP